MSEGPKRRLILLLTSDIVPGTCGKLSAAVLEASGGYDEIHLAISSRGGDFHEGALIYDVLRGLPVSITTHNVGFVQSAAIPVYLVGTTRLAVEDATFLMHATFYAPSGYEILSLDKVEALSKDLEQLNGHFRSILAANSTVPEHLIEASFRFPQTIPATNAITWGLSHEIAPFATTARDKVLGL